MIYFKFRFGSDLSKPMNTLINKVSMKYWFEDVGLWVSLIWSIVLCTNVYRTVSCAITVFSTTFSIWTEVCSEVSWNIIQ